MIRNIICHAGETCPRPDRGTGIQTNRYGNHTTELVTFGQNYTVEKNFIYYFKSFNHNFVIKKE